VPLRRRRRVRSPDAIRFQNIVRTWLQGTLPEGREAVNAVDAPPTPSSDAAARRA